MLRLYSLTAVLVVGLMFSVITGCSKEGPAEKAGKQIDKAGEKIVDTAKDAGDAIKDKAEDADKAVQNAGQK